MIAPALVKEIECLLVEKKHSQRKIASLTGVSRATIGAIARGERPDYEARRLARECEFDQPLGPLERCPGCGGLVYSPCRLCRVRRMKAAEQAVLRARRHHTAQLRLRRLLSTVRTAAQRPEPDFPPTRKAG